MLHVTAFDIIACTILERDCMSIPVDIGGVKRHHHHLAKGERALDQDQLNTLRNLYLLLTA